MTARILLATAFVAGAVAPAGAAPAAPQADVMVVGRTSVLAAAKVVRARAATVPVGRRRCAVAAATALAALDAVRRGGGPAYRLRDYGACTRRAADSTSLFVTQIGPDRNRRANGWVYKVGRRVPGVGAADPSGRMLRAGDRLTWFYCRAQSSGGCQRTLVVTPRSGPGQPLRVVVRGYDDNGRGLAVAGATVTAGGRTALTARDGTASFPPLVVAAVQRVQAQRPGMVSSFPVAVRAA